MGGAYGHTPGQEPPPNTYNQPRRRGSEATSPLSGCHAVSTGGPCEQRPHLFYDTLVVLPSEQGLAHSRPSLQHSFLAISQALGSP